LVVDDKAPRVANFQRATVKAALELMGISGSGCDRDRLREQIYRRTGQNRVQPLGEIYPCLEPRAMLQESIPEFYQKVWQKASAESF
ncbi:MAG: FMN-binding glutamate synthase family protein, partial [Desulfuromusa sp.]|nr:FMN-binding glutamate synthase family protein [Desulfuromusa sp.]